MNDALRQFRERFPMPDINKIDVRATVNGLRRQVDNIARTLEQGVPEMAEVKPFMVDGGAGKIRARLYTPLGAGIGPGPGMVFFHGGGFVVGDLDSHDVACRRLADASRCRIISIDYRLAPEHGFPAAHDDALAAWRWVTSNATKLDMDPARLAIGGDSAGGNLAAYLCQEMTARGGPAPIFQLLIYPLVQFVDIRAKKMPLQESGMFISANIFEFYRDAYVKSEAERMDERVSPLFARDSRFKGLPPGHIIVCGWDPLHDEGLAYASKMASYGVPITVRDYPKLAHAFMHTTSVSEMARDAIRDAGLVLGRNMGAVR